MSGSLQRVKNINDFETTHSFTVFPDDLNYVGTLFGGKILTDMDLTALKAARRLLYGTGADGALTVSLNRVDFHKPAYLGDIIEMKARITKLGRSSIQIHIDVLKEDKEGQIQKICAADFTFVAVKNGVPFAHGCVLVDPRNN